AHAGDFKSNLPPLSPPSAPREEFSVPTDEEYYAALAYYSNLAYDSEPGSDEYVEACMAGKYLRNKMVSMGKNFSVLNSCVDKYPHAPPERVFAEIRSVFGFASAFAKTALPQDVIIKPGFAKIRYVKNNVPYLVQEDSFLKKGEIIFTFDDGPDLSSQGIAADMLMVREPSIFFVLGKKLNSAGRAIIRAENLMGHYIAVHGYYHATETDAPYTAYPTSKILDHISLVSDMIKDAAGAKPLFFRPPYGIMAPDALESVISDLKLVPLGWTIDTLDWSVKSPDELFDKAIALIQKRGKGIILMHDTQPQTAQTAGRLVIWLKDNNYKIVSPERITRAFYKD
ncbi:MAG: polysaccharide deacetylase family protein, partial [Elusimicrobia bacterium]|nr:polysaccharide deacetylase family protein [Elusimicrobiota bacterium]